MYALRRSWLAAIPAACIGLATLTLGCGGNTANPEVKGGKAKGDTKVAGGGSGAPTKPGATQRKDYKVAGYAPSLKGRVTYNGDGKPEIKMLKPQKDQDKCPMEIPAEGWYVNDGNKGIRYTLVFLRPPKDGRMPKAGPAAEKPEKDIVEIGQPKCQFEPRVLNIHPAQKVVFVNDSNPGIAHDANVQGARGNITQTLPPGAKSEPKELEPYDAEAYKLSCGIHQGTMSAYLWKMSHPYAVVTDADGNFELKDVPVLDGGKMILTVWHEMLPDKGFKEIGELDMKPGEPATKDIAIPK